MIEFLAIYLMLGLGVAYGNDTLVLKEHTGGFERWNYALRTMLAWPTYLFEDFSIWMSMDEWEDGDDADG